MRCRLDAPLMALVSEDGHQSATTIPAGRTIKVIGPATDNRFVIIRLKGQEFLVFKADLRQRGTMLTRKEEQKLNNSELQRASGQ